jgi:hypothetical protein
MSRPVNRDIGEQVRVLWTGEIPPVGIETLGFDNRFPQGESQPYYLYEHDADPASVVEVQWEDSHHAAVESWLLPGLRIIEAYPEHVTESKENGIRPVPFQSDNPFQPRAPTTTTVHLHDPASTLPPMLLALTEDEDKVLRRAIVGVADWPLDQRVTQKELWQMLEKDHEGILRKWTRLLETLVREENRQNSSNDSG